MGVACLAPVKREITFPLWCKQYLREYGFTPVMGCAQIDHTPYGLVRSPDTCGGRCLPCTSQGEITFPLLTGVSNISEYGFTQLWECAQIDHTPYGLVRSRA